MPAPRVLIPELPEQSILSPSNLLVVQDGTTTKKMTVGLITTSSQAALDAHINDTTDAHDASAISVAPTGTLTSTNVQSALIELQNEIGSGGGGSVDPEDIVDLIASVLVEGAGIDISYNDAANTITFSATGGGGVDAEAAVDAVAAALVEGTGVDIIYNDALNTITISSTGAGGGASTEDAVDAVAAALGTGGSGINVLYSDLANTITLSAQNVPISSVTNLQTTLDAKVSASQLAAHEADTTNIHGIANTSVLETQSGAQARVDVHVNNTFSAHPASAIVGLGFLATQSSVGTAQILNDAVDNAKLANMPAARLKGTISAGDPVDLSGTQATALLDLATTATKGLIAPLSGSSAMFLNGTGGFSIPSVPPAVQTSLDLKPDSTTVDVIWTGTQAAYDAITPKDGRTLYLIT